MMLAVPAAIAGFAKFANRINQSGEEYCHRLDCKSFSQNINII